MVSSNPETSHWPKLIKIFASSEEARESLFFKFLIGRVCIPFTQKLLEVAVDCDDSEARAAASSIVSSVDCDVYSILHGSAIATERIKFEHGGSLLGENNLDRRLRFMQDAALRLVLSEEEVIFQKCGSLVMFGLVLASLEANREWRDFTYLLHNVFTDPFYYTALSTGITEHLILVSVEDQTKFVELYLVKCVERYMLSSPSLLHNMLEHFILLYNVEAEENEEIHNLGLLVCTTLNRFIPD